MSAVDLGADLAPLGDVLRRVADVDVRAARGRTSPARWRGSRRRRSRRRRDLMWLLTPKISWITTIAAARLARGVGAVRGELVAVGCRQFDHLSHGLLCNEVRIAVMKKNAQELLATGASCAGESWRALDDGRGARRGTWCAPRSRACPRTACRACRSTARCCATAAPTAPRIRRWPSERAAVCLIDNTRRPALRVGAVGGGRGDPARAAERHRLRRHHATARMSGCSASTCAGRRGGAGRVRVHQFPGGDPGLGRQEGALRHQPGRLRVSETGRRALVIDLALTTVVRGKIMMAMRKGERIPEGWALDRHGKPTTDPEGSDRARQPVSDRRRQRRDAGARCSS